MIESIVKVLDEALLSAISKSPGEKMTWVTPDEVIEIIKSVECFAIATVARLSPEKKPKDIQNHIIFAVQRNLPLIELCQKFGGPFGPPQ